MSLEQVVVVVEPIDWIRRVRDTSIPALQLVVAAAPNINLSNGGRVLDSRRVFDFHVLMDALKEVTVAENESSMRAMDRHVDLVWGDVDCSGLRGALDSLIKEAGSESKLVDFFHLNEYNGFGKLFSMQRLSHVNIVRLLKRPFVRGVHAGLVCSMLLMLLRACLAHGTYLGKWNYLVNSFAMAHFSLELVICFLKEMERRRWFVAFQNDDSSSYSSAFSKALDRLHSLRRCILDQRQQQHHLRVNSNSNLVLSPDVSFCGWMQSVQSLDWLRKLLEASLEPLVLINKMLGIKIRDRHDYDKLLTPLLDQRFDGQMTLHYRREGNNLFGDVSRSFQWLLEVVKQDAIPLHSWMRKCCKRWGQSSWVLEEFNVPKFDDEDHDDVVYWPMTCSFRFAGTALRLFGRTQLVHESYLQRRWRSFASPQLVLLCMDLTIAFLRPVARGFSKMESRSAFDHGIVAIESLRNKFCQWIMSIGESIQ